MNLTRTAPGSVEVDLVDVGGEVEVAEEVASGFTSDGFTPWDGQLGLSVVQPAVVAAPAETETEIETETGAEVSFGPIFFRSLAYAALAFFVVTGVAMWAITGEIWDGIGLGAFCAFWGGPGFGLMAAGAKWTHLQERSAHR